MSVKNVMKLITVPNSVKKNIVKYIRKLVVNVKYY